MAGERNIVASLMPTCADVLARTLRDAGITRLYGLPGGEILDFIEAARRAGLTFLLTRQEATASFMADVTGQIARRPGVCVATLGPGAVNMTLGVANAYLDRSPLLAITAKSVWSEEAAKNLPVCEKGLKEELEKDAALLVPGKAGVFGFALEDECDGMTSEHAFQTACTAR